MRPAPWINDLDSYIPDVGQKRKFPCVRYSAARLNHHVDQNELSPATTAREDPIWIHFR